MIPYWNWFRNRSARVAKAGADFDTILAGNILYFASAKMERNTGALQVDPIPGLNEASKTIHMRNFREKNMPQMQQGQYVNI